MTFVKKNITVAILLTLVIASFSISSSASWIWGNLEDVTIERQKVIGNYPGCESVILDTIGTFEHRPYATIGCMDCSVGWEEVWGEIALDPGRVTATKEFPGDCWTGHEQCYDWGITLN